MSTLKPIRFDDFELDEGNASLVRDGTPITLPPKAFSLLCELVRHAGRLATKNDLLDAVWGHRHVSESVLKSTVALVRAALSDDAGEPRYIETVARRGYRFIGRISQTPLPIPALPAHPISPASAMIGRLDALSRLQTAWQNAAAGRRQLIWISGDAGAGKTTLVDRFTRDIQPGRLAHGQCVEQFGAGEPYLPVLEALRNLSKQGPELVTLMRRVAPMWLLQMPWLLADSDRATLRAELAGTGQERMLREMWELMESYSAERPLLLITEDLHWSDQGTLRLMEHFARGRGSMHVLWIATFRLAQVLAEEHPFRELRRELRLHKLCDEVALDPFSQQEVADYVAARMPGKQISHDFVRALHTHTDGLPLFVANVLDALTVSGSADSMMLEAGHDGRELALPVPDNLTGAIEKQLSRLPPSARRVLEAASVCGVEFRVSTIEAILGLDAGTVADCCDELARRQYWLREAGLADLPDGEVDAKYAFRHAVYRHVFYDSLSSANRVAYHRAAARVLEQDRASGMAVTFAELASHHELGREPRAALNNYIAAADSALGHYAPEQALQLSDRALALLPSCTQAGERQECELSLAAMRAMAYGHVLGISARETVDAFARVRDLCRLLPQSPSRALLLNTAGWGLFNRGEYADALALAQEIHAVAETFANPVLQLFAFNLMGVTYATMGRFLESRAVFERGIALCDDYKSRAGGPQLYVDPVASVHANIGPVLAQLGFSAQARAMVQLALDRAEEMRAPMAYLVACWCGGLVGVRLGDVALVDRIATILAELVASTSVHQAIAPSRWFRGWVEMSRGRTTAGLALIREGYSLYHSAGTYASSSETFGYAAEALLLERRWDEAQTELDKANALVERFDERLFVPELLLIQARIHAGRGDTAAARKCTEAAAEEARTKHALTPELKARVALVELASRSAADIEALRVTYARFTEGFDTPVCVRARDLLRQY